MDRKQFILTCSRICLGMPLLTVLGQGCATSYHVVNGTIEENSIKVSKQVFEEVKKGGTSTQRPYVVVRSEKLLFPILLLPQAAGYLGLWLECSHQGSELSVHGQRLVCHAHGSEFDLAGTPAQGPATTRLRTFATTTDSDHIYITLR